MVLEHISRGQNLQKNKTKQNIYPTLPYSCLSYIVYISM